MNKAKLIELRDFLRDNPAKVDMKVWTSDDGCGTSACAAGWAAVLDGVTLPNRPRQGRETWWINPETKTSEWVVFDIDEPEGAVSPYTYGQRVLGLDRITASRLFFEAHNYDVVEYLDRFIEQAEG